MDIMGSFPRSLFSENELKATRWFAAKNGTHDLPTVKVVKNHREQILEVAGASTTTYEGELQNFYAANDGRKL